MRWRWAALAFGWWTVAFVGPGNPGGRAQSRLTMKGRKRKTTADKVQEVEDYLRRIGGSANVIALKTVLRGVDANFLQMYFEVSSDGCVKSKKGFNKQEANIKQFLTSKGVAPIAVVMDTFRVSRRWLESHKDFFVRDEKVKLRVRPTVQREVEIVDEHVGHLFTMGPTVGLSAEKEISRLRIFLMSQVARLPQTDRRNALRRLKGLWHPDVADPSHHAVTKEVFNFLCSIEVGPSGLTMP